MKTFNLKPNIINKNINNSNVNFTNSDNNSFINNKYINITDRINLLERSIIHYSKLKLDLDIPLDQLNDFNPVEFGIYFNKNIQTDKQKKLKGQHYTSIENIHKVIDPLFLNDLTEECNNINHHDDLSINAFRDKLGNIKYFDPAAGSCNFLVETFISLRRLEHKAIFKYNHIKEFDLYSFKTTPYQAFGIEIDTQAIDIGYLLFNLAEWTLERQFLISCSVKSINPFFGPHKPIPPKPLPISKKPPLFYQSPNNQFYFTLNH